MNESDSERLAASLEQNGFVPAPTDIGADIIIANLCSVRQKAIDRVWGKLKVWEKFKPKPKIYLTGCILKGDRKKLAKRVDGIFNISAIADFPTLLQKNFSDDLISDNTLAYFKINPKRARKNIAYIPIATGCNNFCSYCAVPYTRGREISRPVEDILIDAKSALKSGYKKLLFLSQNANSYYGIDRKLKRKIGFGKLLKKIDQLTGDFTYTFLSSNPHDMSDQLINTFSKLKKWDKSLHVAMQSGDDEILQKMNRKYTVDQFLALIGNLNSQISNLKLSTDIIVGFPTESKKAFLNTLKVCKKAKFVKAYISQYSPRPGTIAVKMEDDVPKSEKKRRWQVLNNLINE
jgi:tRNA-2-methylthio-N6-dimethylallyladenosine synthase